MTWKELDDLYQMKCEFQKGEELVERLRLRAEPGAQRMTGMPHGSGVSDQVGDTAIAISDAEEELKDLKTQIEQRETAVREWIKTVENIETRIALRLRFLGGRSWKEVSRSMDKYYTVSRVQAMCYRIFLEGE